MAPPIKEQVQHSVSSLTEFSITALLIIAAPVLAAEAVYDYHASQPDYAAEKAEALKNNTQTHGEMMTGIAGLGVATICVGTYAYMITRNRLRHFSDDVGHMVAGWLPSKKHPTAETTQPL